MSCRRLAAPLLLFCCAAVRAQPAHPDTTKFLGRNLSETMVHTVDGKVVSTATSNIACEYAGIEAPIYLRASIKSTVELTVPRPNGAKSLDVVWIGWNNVITKHVDRYLIVKEFDANGIPIDERCTTYPDQDPPGYIDPLPLMGDRFRFVSTSGDENRYEYDWALQSGASMKSILTTDSSGFPPKTADVTSTTADGHTSAYRFSDISVVSESVGHEIFYEYQKHNCQTISNFTTPDTCVDSWLVLQYECAFTEPIAQAATVHV